jgi:hypothetical protein
MRNFLPFVSIHCAKFGTYKQSDARSTPTDQTFKLDQHLPGVLAVTSGMRGKGGIRRGRGSINISMTVNFVLSSK